MSTSVITSQYERLPQEWIRRTAVSERAHITVIRSVDADRTRIFQALTVGEYMDAWFAAPGMIAGSTAVLRSADGFFISYNSFERGRERFIGSYKLLRRGKVQFSWRRDCLEEADSSLVKIRLQGDFSRTTVHLMHVGLGEAEQSWYRALWEASLDRLARLFRSSAKLPSQFEA